MSCTARSAVKKTVRCLSVPHSSRMAPSAIVRLTTIVMAANEMRRPLSRRASGGWAVAGCRG
eukprot:680630-Prymnesium_polylepis.1